MSKLKVKTYRLDDNIIKIIKNVMEKEEIESEAKAVAYIISEYEKKDSLASETVKAFNEENKRWMDKLLLSSKAAENHGEDIKEILNTILVAQDYEYLIPTDTDMNPVLKAAIERRKEKVARLKQIADERKRKGR